MAHRGPGPLDTAPAARLASLLVPGPIAMGPNLDLVDDLAGGDLEDAPGILPEVPDHPLDPRTDLKWTHEALIKKYDLKWTTVTKDKDSEARYLNRTIWWTHRQFEL